MQDWVQVYIRNPKEHTNEDSSRRPIRFQPRVGRSYFYCFFERLHLTPHSLYSAMDMPVNALTHGPLTPNGFGSELSLLYALSCVQSQFSSHPALSLPYLP